MGYRSGMPKSPVSVVELAGFRRRADELLTSAEQSGGAQGVRGALADVCRTMEKKKMTRRKTSQLADDIRASLHEALDYAAGKRTGAVIHKVSPRATAAREARMRLGLSQH